MELLLAGLGGVVLGALLTGVVVLLVLQKRADRDLVERRIRACTLYLDCLRDLDRVLGRKAVEPEMLEQAWWNALTFCREFRLSGWILPARVRGILGNVVDDLERAERAYRKNGAGSTGRVAQLLCEKYHQVQRILSSELAAEEREFRALRFLPELGRRRQ